MSDRSRIAFQHRFWSSTLRTINFSTLNSSSPHPTSPVEHRITDQNSTVAFTYERGLTFGGGEECAPTRRIALFARVCGKN